MTSVSTPSRRPAELASTSDEPLNATAVADQYAVRVHRFAAMVCRNDSDAADLAQEALVSAIRRLGSFRPDRGSLDSWLWRIVVNTARDAGRASRRRDRLAQRMFGEAATRATLSPEDVAVRELADAELLSAVRRLSKRDRTVIALRFGAELTTTEAARELRTTPAGVAMATRRALQRLRRLLENEG
jgi:RNA polymerase sigma-70 factor, ECF subfamily